MATSFMSEIQSYLNKGKWEYSNVNSPYIGETDVKHREYRSSQQAIGCPPNRLNQFFSFCEKKKVKTITIAVCPCIFYPSLAAYELFTEKYGTCSTIVNISKKILHHYGRHQLYSSPPNPWEWRSAAQNSTSGFQLLTQTAFMKQNWRSLSACNGSLWEMV